MQGSIIALTQRGDITIFDRTPICKRKNNVVDKLASLLPALPYDCCETIVAQQSDTVYALLYQLNLLEIIDDWIFDMLNKCDVTEEVMQCISLKSKRNFLFIDPVIVELHYHANIMDNGFNDTMIIYTSDRDMFDTDEHLDLILNCDPHIEEKKMFYEYVLTYDSINKHELSVDEEFAHHFDYGKDNNEFSNFPGTRYDAAIYTSHCSWAGIDAYTPINDGKPMLLKEFVLYLMKLSAGSNAIVIIIFNQSHYVFGTCGYRGFTIIEIDDNGVITIPNITLNALLNNYKIGDVSKILNDIVLN